MENPNDDSDLRTLADLDAWVERETPELAPQPHPLEPSDERAYLEWCLTVLLSGRTPAWDGPASRPGGWTVSGAEYVAALRWLQERWAYLRSPLSSKARLAYGDPGRGLSKVRAELAFATAFVAVLQRNHLPQERFRFAIPEGLQAEIGRKRLEHPPCIPAESLPLILQWPIWLRPQLANEYLDCLAPGFKSRKNELRARARFIERLDKRSVIAGEGRKRICWDDEDGSPQVGLSPTLSREWEDPTFEAAAARIESRDGALGRIFRRLSPESAGMLSRYLDAKEHGISDQKFAAQENITYTALRKRMQRIRDRIKSVSQNGGIVEVESERSENEVKAAVIAEQNEVLRDVRSRLDGLLVGLEDTISVLVWRFPEREDEIRGKAAEISSILGDEGAGLPQGGRMA